MSRIPQPTRLRQPPSSPSPSTASTRKSFLSPKTIWSPVSKPPTPSVAKYQLQDMGVVPGSPKVVKRGTIRPTNTGGKGKTSTINRDGGGARNADSNLNTPELGSPTSNLAVVNSTIPSSPSPSRIPASQRYSQVHQPSSRRIRINDTSSTSRIPLPQSRPIPKSPQPRLRSGIPIPRPRFPTLVNNPCHSPAISICATVATVSLQSSPIQEYQHESIPESEPVFVPVMTMDREGNSSAHESIYSSASAMALSRYRASLPDNNLEMEERSSVDRETGQRHDLSRISSTTSYSSASSLARHRLSQANALSQAQPMSGTTSTSSESEQALIWQPDPESTGFDPAENLWKEIEARLNRRPASVERGRDERGQWVLTSRQKERRQAQAHDQDQEEILLSSTHSRRYDGGTMPIASTEMRKEGSEFTISAYFDPDLSTPLISRPTVFTRRGSEREMEGTALFDMSAPLVISTSQTGHAHGYGNAGGDEDREGSVGKTPANTPLIHHQTIQRVQRVRKSTLGIQSVGMGSRRSGSRSSRSRLNANIAHSDLGSLMRSRSDSSSAVFDLGPSLRKSTSMETTTVPSPPQTRSQAQTQILISDFKDQRQPDDQNHSENMSPSPSRASSQSGSELGYHRLAGDFVIGMTRLDSHVQAALEELSDYRSIYPTDTTTTVAGDRTPLAGDAGVCGSTGAGLRDMDQQNRQYEHHHRYQYEDGYVNVDAISELGEDESTPMPIPSTVRISPTIPNASDNNEYPLRFQEQLREEIRPDDVGLGMGMDLRLDSIYSLPVVSPRLRIPIPFPAPVPGRVSSPLSMSETDDTSRSSTSNRTSSSESLTRSFSPSSCNSSRPLSVDTFPSSSSDSEGEGSIYKTHDIQDEVQFDIPLLSQISHLASENHVVERKVEGGQEEEVEQEEEEEMLTITDLDTGHRVDLSIKRLDELELWRL